MELMVSVINFIRMFRDISALPVKAALKCK